MLCFFFFFFFFSSRRRHTRSKRDWSSDVCSSDLLRRRAEGGAYGLEGFVELGEGSSDRVQKRRHAPNHHEAVPEASLRVEALGELWGRLLPEAAYARDRPRLFSHDGIDGLDPPVPRLRTA